MKRNLSYLSVLLFFVAAIGCKKDFLAAPTNDITLTPAVVFGDSLKAGGFLATTYANMYNEGLLLNGNSWGYCTLNGEIMHPIPFDPVFSFLDGSLSPSSSSLEGGLGGIFTTQYQRIRQCNLLFAYQDTMKFNPELKKQYIGEAHFLRAFFYFQLLQRYGGVPLVAEATDVNVITSASGFPAYKQSIYRASFASTVQFILDDLKAAQQALMWYPLNDNTDRGRATAAAAVALKSRLLLYAASPLYNSSEHTSAADSLVKYDNYDANRWKLAADAAQEFITLNQLNGNWYNLYPSYPNLFLQGRDANNHEIIWYRQSYPFSKNNIFPGRTGDPGYFTFNVTASTIDVYEMANGKYITDNTSGYNPNQPFTGRDPRLGYNIGKSGDTWAGYTIQMYPSGADYGARALTGNFLKKGIPSDANVTPQKWHFIRLAEIYLNLAEALNEYSGPSTAVYDALNMSRNRATVNMPLVTAADGLNQGQLQAKIRKERLAELAFENHSYFDQRRWKDIDALKAPIMGYRAPNLNVGNWTKIELFSRVFTPNMYLYPIPYSEMIKGTNILQNPGYN